MSQSPHLPDPYLPSPALSSAQRRHLIIANVDAAKLTRTLWLIRDNVALAGVQWLAGAAAATAVADQLDQIAALATTPADCELWARSARLVHDTAARFELCAELADTEHEVLRDAAHGPA